MPEANEFLDVFGLIIGTKFDGYTLKEASSTHESIKRYQEYNYNITLVFTNMGSGTYDTLFYSLIDYISQQPIIYGLRNPYKCSIKPPTTLYYDNDGSIIFQLTGHSYRV